MKEIEKKLCEVMDKVSGAEGLRCIVGLDHELGFRGPDIDNYLAISVLSDLIKKDKVKLNFYVDMEDEKYEYLCKLLHM